MSTIRFTYDRADVDERRPCPIYTVHAHDRRVFVGYVYRDDERGRWGYSHLVRHNDRTRSERSGALYRTRGEAARALYAVEHPIIH